MTLWSRFGARSGGGRPQRRHLSRLSAANSIKSLQSSSSQVNSRWKNPGVWILVYILLCVVFYLAMSTHDPLEREEAYAEYEESGNSGTSHYEPESATTRLHDHHPHRDSSSSRDHPPPPQKPEIVVEAKTVQPAELLKLEPDPQGQLDTSSGGLPLEFISSKRIDPDTFNARAVREARERLCQKMPINNSPPSEEVLQQVLREFPPERTVLYDKHKRNEAGMGRCQHVVLDLGAHNGDGLLEIMDSTFVCPTDKNSEPAEEWHPPPYGYNYAKRSIEMKPDRLAVDAPSGTVPTKSKTQIFDKLRRDFQARAETASSRLLGAENYCYFGVEGNPVWTFRLRKLENWISSIDPRPIAYAHFLTSMVASDINGDHIMYLDTASTLNDGDRKYSGSSIVHHAPKHEARSPEQGIVGLRHEVAVKGYTLQTFLNWIVSNTDGRSHVIIFMDIEGSEYDVLRQAIADNSLCNLAKNRNVVDLVAAFHPHITKDTSEELDRIRNALQACGVRLLL